MFNPNFALYLAVILNVFLTFKLSPVKSSPDGLSIVDYNCGSNKQVESFDVDIDDNNRQEWRNSSTQLQLQSYKK